LEGEKRKSFRQFNRLFGVFFELSEVLNLYRGFVTGLAKIAASVNLVDKIKWKHNH